MFELRFELTDKTARHEEQIEISEEERDSDTESLSSYSIHSTHSRETAKNPDTTAYQHTDQRLLKIEKNSNR